MSMQTDTFRIRWGKVALALVGVLALIAIPVTLVVALLTPLSWWTPLVCAVLVAVSLAGLRASAVRDRRVKAWERAQAAVPVRERERVAAVSAGSAAEAKDTADADQTSGQASKSGPREGAAEARAQETAQATQQPAVEDRPFDLLALDEAPAETVADRRDVTVVEPASPSEDAAEPATAAEPITEAAAQRAASGAQPQGTAPRDGAWQPRELPAPSYVGAPRAERPAPAPLEKGEEKKAKDVTSIRQAEVERQAEERAERLNLDAVLKRRRA